MAIFTIIEAVSLLTFPLDTANPSSPYEGAADCHKALQASSGDHFAVSGSQPKPALRTCPLQKVASVQFSRVNLARIRFEQVGGNVLRASIGETKICLSEAIAGVT